MVAFSGFKSPIRVVDFIKNLHHLFENSIKKIRVLLSCIIDNYLQHLPLHLSLTAAGINELDVHLHKKHTLLVVPFKASVEVNCFIYLAMTSNWA